MHKTETSSFRCSRSRDAADNGAPLKPMLRRAGIFPRFSDDPPRGLERRCPWKDGALPTSAAGRASSNLLPACDRSRARTCFEGTGGLRHPDDELNGRESSLPQQKQQKPSNVADQLRSIEPIASQKISLNTIWNINLLDVSDKKNELIIMIYRDQRNRGLTTARVDAHAPAPSFQAPAQR